jgi:hypothetical protein
VDLNVEGLSDDDLRWADYVMLSAMIAHKTVVASWRLVVTALLRRPRQFPKAMETGHHRLSLPSGGERFVRKTHNKTEPRRGRCFGEA